MSKVNLCNLDTAQLPRLTNEECEALLKKSSNGDEKARETLVMANIRLVLSLVQGKQRRFVPSGHCGAYQGNRRIRSVLQREIFNLCRSDGGRRDKAVYKGRHVN